MWTPRELEIIEKIRESIESPKDNIEKVFSHLTSFPGDEVSSNEVRRIIIGLVLLDSNQYYFYKTDVNAKINLGVKDRLSDWHIIVFRTPPNKSLKEGLTTILNLSESLVNKILERAK